MRPVADQELIRAVFARPDIWPHVSDDFSGPAEDWQPQFPDGVHWLMPERNDACFLMHKHRETIWEVHAAVLPDARERSVEYGKQVIEWMRANTKCACILSYVPRGKYAALALDRALGFRRVGTLPKCLRWNGRMVEQTLMALEL